MSGYNRCIHVEFHLFWILDVSGQSCPELQLWLEQILLVLHGIKLNQLKLQLGRVLHVFSGLYSVVYTRPLSLSVKKEQFMQPIMQHWFQHLFFGGENFEKEKKKNPPKPQDQSSCSDFTRSKVFQHPPNKQQLIQLLRGTQLMWSDAFCWHLFLGMHEKWRIQSRRDGGTGHGEWHLFLTSQP